MGSGVSVGKRPAAAVYVKAIAGYAGANRRIRALPLGSARRSKFVRGVSVAQLGFLALSVRPAKDRVIKARKQLMTTI